MGNKSVPTSKKFFAPGDPALDPTVARSFFSRQAPFPDGHRPLSEKLAAQNDSIRFYTPFYTY